ncbi:hypothetical protein HG537_0B06940 [Torulaspora globosa]|uniref:L-type lectin-like domain-containing protein n=1 Tax=Torulaspora globosa TaxID=48254 RepID=A0A7H9HQ66_9SACH|nr:hypothetical protein HG537_0B06940 [Torulaspora sp. CBS 2947]
MRISRSNAAFAVVLASFAVAHPTGQLESAQLNEALSLPDLVSLSSVPKSWIAGESCTFEEGRILLTPQQGTKGSLWEKENYKLRDSFTLEWTFRSVNYEGKSEGGLAFWFLNPNEKSDLKDKTLYNGPAKFDGLQLLVDNNGPLSSTMRAQLNDGGDTFTAASIYDRTFASCLMGYQESPVPSTLRLTYDGNSDNLLKLQVNNKICFQTRKVRFPEGEYRIGVTADNANTAESFEILKMSIYDGPIEDSYIPNVNAMAQPRVLTKVIDKETGEEKLLEKEAYEIENDKVSNYELYKKLDRVEGKILANDINTIEHQLAELRRTQEELLKYVTQLAQVFKSSVQKSQTVADEDKNNYGDFLSLNEKLEKMLLDQEKIREMTKHASGGPHIDDIASKLAIWLFPLIAIMLVMAYYTFKIRQEIVKTKLL